MKYIVLLRGINVGGKNKISMSELRTCLERLGFKSVSTYIASGNVILESKLEAKEVEQKIEKALPKHFRLDRDIIRILALTEDRLKRVVKQAPKEFGSNTARHRYDVVFLMGITPQAAMKEIEVNPEVDDAAWQGEFAIYYRRLSVADPRASRTKLSKIIMKPIYQDMTIRSWSTTMKLYELIEANRATG